MYIYSVGVVLLQDLKNVMIIEVGQKEIKITQYADDTTIFVRDFESVLNY